jgi:hypothetical protein
MCNVLRTFISTSLFLVFAAGVIAQPSELCNIPPGLYRTQTQGGWGSNCHGGNPGCLRDTYFPTAFPAGLTIGGGFTVHFTSAAAVRDFLPAGSTPDILTANYTNPLSTEAGVFAGQVTALALSAGFADAGVPGFGDLRHLIIKSAVHEGSGAFAGVSIGQLLAIANQVLGGDLSALPAGISVSDLNDVVDALNNNFDNGTLSGGYVAEPGCDEILPVELSSFTALGQTGSILIRWQTASETAVDFYTLMRDDGNEDWRTVTSIPSQGDNPNGFVYTYADNRVVTGAEYRYRLSIHNLDGTESFFAQTASATALTSALPASSTLYQNYPNPFNPTTTIRFALADAETVKLTIYDLAGRTVASLIDEELSAGSHEVTFNASALTSGVYFYRLNAGNMSSVKKFVLMK